MKLPHAPPGRPKTTNSIRGERPKQSPRKKKPSLDRFGNTAESNEEWGSKRKDTDGMIIFECAIRKKDRSMSFIVREFPVSANFFSLDICVIKTQQQWCVFVPVIGDLGELLRLWKMVPRYENKREIGEWLLRSTKIEFKKDTITGADFNQAALQERCRHELVRLINSMAAKIQSIYRMYLVRRRMKTIVRIRSPSPPKRARSKKSGRKVPRSPSPGRRSPIDMQNLRTPPSPTIDMKQFKTLHFADLPPEYGWDSMASDSIRRGGESFHTRQSQSAGVANHRRPQPPSTSKDKKSAVIRFDRSFEFNQERSEKLSKLAAVYLPPQRPRAPSPGRAVMLSELKALRNDMVGALSTFESELEHLKEDYGRSIVSNITTSQTSHMLDFDGSLITADDDIESPSKDEKMKLKDELTHMQQEMQKLQSDLNKQRELNLIARKFEVDAADPVQWSAWTCIQHGLLVYVRRIKFQKRINFLLEKMDLISEESLIREGLMKSVESGNIALALRTLCRVYTIVISHSQQDNIIMSNYVPTNIFDLKLIFDALCAFVSITSVMKVGVDLILILLAISNIDGMVNMVGEAGACELVLTAMKRYSKDGEMSAAMVKACNRLIYSSDENAQKMLVGTFYVGLRLMFVRNSSNPDVTEKLARFLCKLYTDYDGIRESYLEYNLYQAMVKCIEQQISAPESLFVICKTVINLCSNRNENCRPIFSIPENIDLYVASLEANCSNEKCYKQIAVMIVCICGKQEEIMEIVANSRLVAVLKSILSTTDDTLEEVVKSTVTLVYNFCGYEIMRNLFLVEEMDTLLDNLSQRPFSKGTITGIRQTRFRLTAPALYLSPFKSTGAQSIEDRLLRSEAIARSKKILDLSKSAAFETGSVDGIHLKKMEAEINVLLTLIDDSNDPEIILHCLRQSIESSNADLADKTMRRVESVVASSSHAEQTLMSTFLGEHHLLLDLMLTFVASQQIQFIGFKVLLQLRYSKNDMKAFGNAGVCQLITSAMKEHRGDENVIATSLAYANLLTSTEKGLSENRVKLTTPEVLNQLVEVIDFYLGNAEIMSRTLQLLRNLTIDSVVNQEKLGRGGLCEKVISYMAKNATSDIIVGLCTRTVFSLCAKCDMNRVICGSPHSFCVFVDIISVNLGMWKICKQMCMVMVDILGKGELGIDTALITSGVHVRLCRILEGLARAESPDDDIIQSLLMLVACIVYNVTDIRPKLVEAGLLLTLKSILDGHYGYNIVKLAKVITNYLRKNTSLGEHSVETPEEKKTSELGPSQILPDKSNSASLVLTKLFRSHHQNKILKESAERAQELLDVIGRTRDVNVIMECMEVSVNAGSILLASKTVRRIHAVMVANLTATPILIVPIAPALMENIHLLVALMANFLSDPKIQTLGLGVLQQLSYQNDDVQNLGEIGVCELCADAMVRHLDDEDIAASCLSFALLLTSTDTGVQQNRDRMALPRVAAAIINVLRIFIDEADIVAKCFQLMRNICLDSPTNQGLLGTAGACERVMSYLARNKSDEIAVSISCHTILSLCAANERANRNILASTNAIEFYLNIIHEQVLTPKICKNMCMLLVGLSEIDRDHMSDVFYHCKMASVLNTLLLNRLTPASAQAIIMLTVHIIIALPMQRQELLAAGIGDTLVRYTGGGYIEAIRKTAATGIRRLYGDSKPSSANTKESSPTISAQVSSFPFADSKASGGVLNTAIDHSAEVSIVDSQPSSVVPDLGSVVADEQMNADRDQSPPKTPISTKPFENIPSEIQILAADTIQRSVIARRENIAQKQRLIELLSNAESCNDLNSIVKCLQVCVELGSVDLGLRIMNRVDCLTTSDYSDDDLRPTLLHGLCADPHLILDVMSSFISIGAIQSAALRIVSRLPASSDDMNRFGIAGYCNVIIDVLDRHVSDEGLCHACILLAIRLTTDCTPNKLRMPHRRCGNAIAYSMAAHSRSEIIVGDCVRLVRILCFDAREMADMMGKCGVCDKVMAHMMALREDESVVFSCIQTITALCAGDKGANREYFSSRDCMQQYMQIIKANLRKPKTCKHVCKLLVDFCGDGTGSVGDELVFSGIAADLVLALSRDNFSAANPEVTEALIMLTVHFSVRVPILASELVAAGMIPTLRWHRDNNKREMVQRVVTIGITKLSEISPSVKNEAAKMITKQLSVIGFKNTSRARLENCISEIEITNDCDVIVDCLQTSVEFGNVPLAKLAMHRANIVISQEEDGHNSLRESLIQTINNDPRLILDVMSSFVSIIEIPVTGLHICTSLFVTTESFDLIGSQGGLHVVINMLDRHSNDPSFCMSCILFGEQLIEKCPANKKRMLPKQCCQSVRAVMDKNGNYRELMEVCLRYIRILCFDAREMADMMGKCGVCDKVMAHMMALREDESVVFSCIQTITALCAGDKGANREYFSSRDCMQQYMQIIKANLRKPKTCKHVCKLLVDFCGDGTGSVGDELVFSGIASDLVFTLSAQNCEDATIDVMQALIMLAVHFTVNVHILRSELASAGMVETYRRFQQSDRVSDAVKKACALGIRKLSPRSLKKQVSMPIYDLFGIDGKEGSQFEGTEANSDDDFFAEKTNDRQLTRMTSRISADSTINEKYDLLDTSLDEDFILDCLKTATETGVVDLCVRAMWRVHFMVDSTIDRKVLLNPSRIIDALSKFLSNSEIQTLGLGVLLRLPKHPGIAERLGAAQVLDVIAENLRIHSSDVDICEVSLNLATQLTKISVYNRRIFAKSAIMKSLSAVIYKHANKEEVMKPLCNLVGCVCTDSPESQTCLGEHGITASLFQQILEAPTDESIIFTRTESLMKLCECGNITNRLILTSDERIGNMISVIRANSDNVKICKQMCKLLVDICGKGEELVGDNLLESGIALDLCALLKPEIVKQTKSQNIQAIIMLVVYLIVNIPALRASFIDVGAIDMLKRFKLVFDDELRKAVKLGIQKLEPRVLERASSFQNKWRPQFSNISSLMGGSPSKTEISAASIGLIIKLYRRYHERKVARDELNNLMVNVDQLSSAKQVAQYMTKAISTGNCSLAMKTMKQFRCLVDTENTDAESVRSVSKHFSQNPRTLIDLMSAFLSITEIQIIGVDFLSRISATAIDAEKIGSGGVCNLIFHILRRHVENVALCTAVMAFAELLSADCIGNRVKMCRSKCCDILHGILSSHVENPDVMEISFRVIRNLCVGLPENQDNLANAAISSIVLKHLTVSTSTDGSVIACLHAISGLCANDDTSNRLIFATSNALRILLQTARSRPRNPAICKMVCKLLASLVGKGDNALDDEVLQSGIARDLVDCLSENSVLEMSQEISEALTMLTVQFIVNIPVIRLELAEEGMIDILKRLGESSSKEGFQKCCAIGVRKLVSESAAYKDQAAKIITKQLSEHGAKLAAKAKLLDCIEKIDDATEGDSIIQSLRTGVEMGNVELAIKSMKRVSEVSTATNVDEEAMRERMVTALCNDSNLLIDVMSSFISIAEIQTLGLSVLKTIPRSVADRDTFCAAGASMLISVILHRHVTNTELCMSALSTALELVSGSPSNALLFSQPKSCSVLHKVMVTQSKSHELMAAVLQLIRHISNSGVEGQTNLGKAGICSEVVKYLISNVSDESVVTACLSTITSLCANNHKLNKSVLAAPNSIRLYIKLASMYSETLTTANCICESIVDLVGEGEYLAAHDTGRSEIASDIATIFSDSNEKKIVPEILETLILVAVHFAVNVSVLRSELVNAGLIEKFQNIMNGPYNTILKKNVSIGIRKLTSSQPEIQDAAARKITRHLSGIKPRKESTTKLRDCLSQIESTLDKEVILLSFQASVELGNAELALKSIRRLSEVLAHSVPEEEALQSSLVSALMKQVSILIDVMSSFVSIAEIQTLGLSVLKTIPRGAADRQLLGEGGAHMLISVILHRHMTNTELCMSALSTALELVSDSPSNALLFSQPKSCSVLHKVMVAQSKSHELMAAVLQLIRHISNSGVEGQTNLGKAGICSEVVKYLISNVSDESVVTACLSTITSLCANNHELNRSVLGSEKHLRLYLHIIRCNPYSVKVTNRVCKLLVDLCGKGEEPIGTELIQGHVAGDLVSMLAEDSEKNMSPDVLQALVLLIVHFVVNVPILRAAMASAGIGETLQRFTEGSYPEKVNKAAVLGVRKYKEFTIKRDAAARTITRQLSAVRTKTAMLNKLDECMSQIDNCVDSDVILTSLRTSVQSGSAELATKSIKRVNDVIQSSFTEIESLRESLQIKLCSDITVILNLMSSFASIAEIQTLGLSVLKTIPRSVADRDTFCAAGANMLISVILHRHVTNTELCMSALSTALELVSGSLSNALLFSQPKSCSVLHKVMVAQSKSHEVMAAVLQLIRHISNSGVEGQTNLGKAGICSEVVKYLISNVSDESVVTACLSTITSLCANNHELNRSVLGSEKHLRLYLQIISESGNNLDSCQRSCKHFVDLCGSGEEPIGTELIQGGVAADLVSMLSEERVKVLHEDALQTVIMLAAHCAVNIRVIRPVLVSAGMVEIFRRFAEGSYNVEIKKAISKGLRKLESSLSMHGSHSSGGLEQDLNARSQSKERKVEDFSQLLVSAARSRDFDVMNEVLSRLTISLENSDDRKEDKDYSSLIAAPSPLFNGLRAFETDPKIASKILSIIYKMLKLEGCNRDAFTSPDNFRLLVNILRVQPNASKVCKRLCMLLVDLAGSGEGVLGDQLIASGIASDLASILSSNHLDKKISDDILQAIVMLVVHFIMNVSNMRSQLVAVGIKEILEKYRDGGYGERMTQATVVGIRKLNN